MTVITAAPARVGVAEVAMVGHAEDAHRGSEFARAERRESGLRFERRLQVIGDDLAAFAPRAGQHGDRGTAGDEGRDRSPRFDGLVVGVGVNEQHAFRSIRPIASFSTLQCRSRFSV